MKLYIPQDRVGGGGVFLGRLTRALRRRDRRVVTSVRDEWDAAIMNIGFNAVEQARKLCSPKKRWYSGLTGDLER